eukprot:CAMPEP_0115832576 /NCGR_PEP_ID=MMETSP0287-20121206/2730_1 /TAXON_ID=412157 /ORGANISM="Chrysochromulina rotalis, Strain UIO044" /LENGTH=48 /DNA_ID= /DNA_START= /DNA_END= /DNA_ORIENTATION=
MSGAVLTMPAAPVHVAAEVDLAARATSHSSSQTARIDRRSRQLEAPAG